MRRRLGIAVAALLAALAVAGPAAAQAPPAPATIAPGVLTVGLSMPSDGFQTGAVIGSQVTFARGFEIDLARAIGRKAGLPVQFVQIPVFSDVVAAGPKPFDVALAQVTITAGRRANVDFSTPYLQADEGVLLRRGLSPSPRTLAALKGLKICVQKGTTGAAIVARRVAPTTPARGFAAVTRMLQALQTGNCDAVVYDAPSLAVLRAEVPLRVGDFAGVIATGERYGAVLPDGSTLTPTVNRAIQALNADGTITRLSTKWLSVKLTSLRVLS